MRRGLLVLGLVLSWAHIQLDEISTGADSPSALAREGRLREALQAYPAALESRASQSLDADLVRGYLQARHLGQGEPQPRLECAKGNRSCQMARLIADRYGSGIVRAPDAAGMVPFGWGESGHAVVRLAGTEGTQGAMVVDTASVATILPRSLQGSVQARLFDTRVANMGRLASLTLVRAGPFALGHWQLPEWVMAVTGQGFEREGVLGLDMLHSLGGIDIDTRARQLRFLGGRCPEAVSERVTLEGGVPVALVQIDGRPHRALLDTGSVRSYVHAPGAEHARLRVVSDFGDVHLVGRTRVSHIRVVGVERVSKMVHTPEAQRFPVGTTALLGADVLLSGGGMQFCFEPARVRLY
ncbi:MAG: hypothetical protein H6993_10950 [Pseudomonadales bacterium]|nr:hypothetical protein [Pseudomonadales bacterium]